MSKVTKHRERLLEAAAVLALLSAAALFSLDRAELPLPQITAADLAVGESLLHGVAAPGDNSVTTSMPLSTAWHALWFGHLDFEAARGVWLALNFVLLLSAAALASELAAWPAALATVVLLGASLRDWLSLTNTVQTSYALLVVLAAWTAARFARKPGPRTGAALGAALATTVLYRSPLLFVPPLLALGFLARPLRRSKGTVRGLALAVSIPVLMLLPWTRLNYVLHGTLNPAEHMRSDTNIVSGALGLTVNIEGDIRSLAPEAGFEPGKVLGWAARRVLAEPGPYANAVLARVVYAFTLAPWLWLLALAGLWLGRGDPGTLAVGGLAAYFLGVHVLMPVAAPYLIPFHVLLAVLAASATAKAAVPSPAKSDGPSRLFARGFLAGALALAAALGAYATLKVVLFDASDAGTQNRWARALHHAPDDAWLLGRRGEAILREGRPRDAAADFALALRAAPLDGELRSLHGYALALSGHPAALQLVTLGPEASSQARHRLPFYKAASAARNGRMKEARALMREAIAGWASTSATTNRRETALERSLADRLRPPPLTELLASVMAPMKAEERLVFLSAVAASAPDEQVADAIAVGAVLELQRGRETEALALWRRAVTANPAGVCALSSEPLGGPARSELPLAFFDACLARLPMTAKLWADRGIARAARNDPAAAADLRRSLEIDPSSQEAVLTLAYILQIEGRSGEAIALVEEALRRPGGSLRRELADTAVRLRSPR